MDEKEPETVKWTFAKTYAKKAPHEYIVQNKFPEMFDKLSKEIDEYGVMEKFQMFGHVSTQKYLHLGAYRYWRMDDILNRCKESDYKRTPDGTMYYPASYNEPK